MFAVHVWVTESSFVTTTVVPTLIVSDPGENAKLRIAIAALIGTVVVVGIVVGGGRVVFGAVVGTGCGPVVIVVTGPDPCEVDPEPAATGGVTFFELWTEDPNPETVVVVGTGCDVDVSEREDVVVDGDRSRSARWWAELVAEVQPIRRKAPSPKLTNVARILEPGREWVEVRAWRCIGSGRHDD